MPRFVAVKPALNGSISPQFIAAKHISAHRVSAIALYRALLIQCCAAPLADEARKSLHNAIRNQFRSKRHASGHARLQDAFARGYHLLDLLDKITSADATTSSRVLNYLNTKIPTLPPTLTTSQPLPPRPPKHTTPASSLLSVPNPFPNPGSFLTAPALPVSAFKNGKRRIPYLVSANKIPMIRFRKPQPPALSAYISNRNRTRQKRTNRLHACEDAVAVAEREDEWDFILAEQGARERDGFGNGDGQGEERFVEAAQMAFDEVSGLINRDAIRLREVGERMWAFVQREKGLAARERAERKKERTDKKRERNKRRAETWRERTAEARDERVESELVERVSRTA